MRLLTVWRMVLERAVCRLVEGFFKTPVAFVHWMPAFSHLAQVAVARCDDG